MKTTRNIVKRLELKIYHAITLEQMKKNESAANETKPVPAKMDGPMDSK